MAMTCPMDTVVVTKWSSRSPADPVVQLWGSGGRPPAGSTRWTRCWQWWSTSSPGAPGGPGAGSKVGLLSRSNWWTRCWAVVDLLPRSTRRTRWWQQWSTALTRAPGGPKRVESLPIQRKGFPTTTKSTGQLDCWYTAFKRQINRNPLIFLHHQFIR